MIDANDVHPLPDDGAVLLDDLRDKLKRYTAFGDEHSPSAVALWIATTHTLPAFDCAPRLAITSPQKRCGKSRLLDIIAGTCHDPLATADATVAAIFRSLGGDHPPTLIIDEADTLWGSKKLADQNEDLRKLINAGHQRGRPALRCVGPTQKPTPFNVFAMAALAGIGSLPDTITDRAINVAMRRRSRGEKVSQFRSRRDGPKLHSLRDRLAGWAPGVLNELSDAEPVMPVEDRAADTWEPLIAVADVAGGRWPDLARAACVALVAAADADDEDKSHAVKLLADIREIFAGKNVSFLGSAELVADLRRIEESPWNEYELNVSKLSYRLRTFGVRPGRNPAGTKRGYALEAFSDAFERYTCQNLSDPSEPQADSHLSSDGSDTSDGPERQTESTRQTNTADRGMFLTSLTGSDGGRAKNAPTPAAMPSTTAVKPAYATASQSSRQRHRSYGQQPTGNCPSCTVCGKPVVAGQGDTHLSCKSWVAS